MIHVDKLSKTFWVHTKSPGLWGSIRSLVKRQKVAKSAVSKVSFDVEEGEVVGLVGANGAGKTTLVKMLAGIVHPTAGSARVLGYEPWSRDDRLRRNMALIMGQKAQLWWDLPAADSFLLLREIYQVPKARFEHVLDELVDLLEVRDELNVQVRRLSLGERMKMELIAALLHSPRVVYLDEPTIGLDLGAQRAVRRFVHAYRQEHQPAMLVTSHYMEDIESLCERILILRRGELVYDGSRRAVVERFALSKRLVVHLKQAPSAEAFARLKEITERVESGRLEESRLEESSQPHIDEAGTLRLTVPRHQAASAASAVMKLVDVGDLSIEEEPLGDIIERLQKSRGDLEDQAPREEP